MSIILGGYFETALIHYIDETAHPSRNKTPHPYYMCLNRRVPKAYFDRAATFVSIAQEVAVHSIDWGLPSFDGELKELAADRLGIDVNGEQKFGGREWDDDTVVFVDILFDARALSSASWIHVSRLDAVHRGIDLDSLVGAKRDNLRRQIAQHYVCRLLLQVRAAGESRALLVLSEDDIQVLSDIGRFLQTHDLPSPFEFPNLTGQVVTGEDFAAGLLNFSPPDALALAAVKSDPVVKSYASKISPFLTATTESIEAQRALLQAMKDAHDRAEAGRRAEKIFEIASWCVKPLHYVPGVGEALTFAEDVKDVVNKWVDRETEVKEWYLLGARMTDIAIKDYLNRKDNLFV